MTTGPGHPTGRAGGVMDGPGVAPAKTSARYRAMVERLFHLSRGGTKLGLEPVARGLAAIGHPELAFPAIHIAGSNGKGSTSAFLATILAAHGYKVGLYTSPHLVSFTERVRVLEGDLDADIEPEALADAVDAVEAAIPGFEGLSFFEVTTLAAMLAFERMNIDVAVVEAGLGARLDATRLVDASVAVLTDLCLEHTEFLGDTIEDIAREEGAVIRPDRPLVMADGPPAAMAVVDAMAAQARAPVHRIGDDIDIVETPTGFDLDLGTRELTDVTLALPGPHQRRNALLAAKAAILYAPQISDATLHAGLRSAYWPGRMQWLDLDPPVLLDGAHNAQGAQILAAALAAEPERFGRPSHLVFGVFADKDVDAMFAALAPHAASIVFTRPSSPRARDPKALAAAWPGAAETSDLVADAFAGAAARARADGGQVVVCGSLYLIGDVLGMLNVPNLRRFSAR